MVYFVSNSRYVKIGYTENPLRRLSEIQVSNPEKLEVLLLIEGDIEYEQQLHSDFNKWHKKGEWFYICEEISGFIKDNLQDDLRPYYGMSNLGVDYSKMKLKKMRKENDKSLRNVGELMGITSQSVKEAETREFEGGTSLRIMEKYGEALGYDFYYGFKKKKERCKHIRKEGDSCSLNNNCKYPNCNEATL